jgi:muramoyltetrapeptide carboxypeptidase
VLVPDRLEPGNRVRLVSPASTPTESHVERASGVLEAMGLEVEIGRHVFAEHGYLAGRDEDRLRDITPKPGRMRHAALPRSLHGERQP